MLYTVALAMFTLKSVSDATFEYYALLSYSIVLARIFYRPILVWWSRGAKNLRSFLLGDPGFPGKFQHQATSQTVSKISINWATSPFCCSLPENILSLTPTSNSLTQKYIHFIQLTFTSVDTQSFASKPFHSANRRPLTPSYSLGIIKFHLSKIFLLGNWNFIIPNV